MKTSVCLLRMLRKQGKGGGGGAKGARDKGTIVLENLARLLRIREPIVRESVYVCVVVMLWFSPHGVPDPYLAQ